MSDFTFGTVAELNAAATYSTRVVKIDTDKFAVAYISGSAGYVRVATVSGTTITWGSASQFDSDVVVGSVEATPVSICKLDTDKIMVAFTRDAAGDDGFCRAVTISGTTIGTWGSVKEFEFGNSGSFCCVGIDTDKAVIGFEDISDGGDATCSIITASGTTLNKGGGTKVGGGNTYAPKGCSIAKLDTDKFIFTFSASGASDDGYAVVATVSGTTITYGTVVEFETSQALYTGVCSPDTDKFVICSGGATGECVAGTVSGTTITLGSQSEFDSSAATCVQCAAIDTTHFVVVYADANDSSKGKAIYCSVDFSDRSLTIGTPEEFESGATGGGKDWGIGLDLIDTDKIAIAFQDDGDSDYGKAIVATIGGAAPPSTYTSILPAFRRPTA